MYGYLRLDGRISSSWIFFQGTFTGSRLFGLGSVGTESGNKFLELFDLLFFFLICFFHLLDQKLAGFIPEIIVTCVQLNFTIINISSLCTNLVQEVTVMGYHDNSIIKIDQEFFKPLNSREDPDGWLGSSSSRMSGFPKKCLCKKNLDLHATGQVSHLCIVEFSVNSKTVQKSSSIGFCFPSSSSLTNSPSSSLVTDSVFVGKILLGVNGFLLFHDLIETKVTHNYSVENCIGIIFEVILL